MILEKDKQSLNGDCQQFCIADKWNEWRKNSFKRIYII